jgi:predicted transcriptional regulator
MASTIRAMTTKERLHQLVDELSETEAGEALRYVTSRHEDPLVRRLDAAPLEDEEISAEEEAAAAEGRADIAAGRVVSHEEMLRKYG